MNIFRATTGFMMRTKQFVPLPAGWDKPLARGLGWLNRAGHAGPEVHPVGPFLMRLDLEQYIDSKLYYTGQFEPATVEAIRSLVRRGAHAVDVGANIGYISLILGDCVGERGRVHAFEASRWSYDRLVNNAQLNPTLPITPYHAAVSDQSAVAMPMSLPNGYRLDGRNTATEQMVDLISLDDWVEREGIGRIDFIKIDTDGWEAHIIDGAAATLERLRPDLIFEFGPQNLRKVGRDGERLLESLEALGYRFYRIPSLEPVVNLRGRIASFGPGETINLAARCASRL